MREKLSDFVSIKDLAEVVGDGSTDDTAAWAAAITEAASQGVSLHIPAGTYMLDDFELISGVSMRGDGSDCTILKARSGNTDPFITMPAGRVRDVSIGGFMLQGNASNTGQGAMYFEAQLDGADGGFWYSCFHDIKIRDFPGDNIHFLGSKTTVDRPHQFISFRDIDVMRPASSTAHSLKLEGQCEHFTFYNCQFDGTNSNYTGTNIRLTRNIASGGDIRPNAIKFINCTSQWAEWAAYVDRAENVSFDTHWFESLKNGVDIQATALNVDFFNCRFANAANNAGAGIAVRAGGNTFTSLRYCRFTGTNDTQVSCSGHTGFDIVGCPDITVTSGVTPTISYASGATITTQAHKVVIIGASAGLTCTTITSKRGVGETLTLRINTNGIDFATGGNLYLGPGVATLTVPVGSVVTFTRNDATSANWYLTGVT